MSIKFPRFRGGGFWVLGGGGVPISFLWARSEFWSEFCSDHGLSFLARGQKHWGRGRRVSIDP